MASLYTLLPAEDDPDGEHTSYHVRQIVKEEFNVVYVLLARKRGEDLDRMRKVAIDIANGSPNLRRVVEVAPKYLDDELLEEITEGNTKIHSAVYGHADAVVARLPRGLARSKLAVLEAFNAE